MKYIAIYILAMVLMVMLGWYTRGPYIKWWFGDAIREIVKEECYGVRDTEGR